MPWWREGGREEGGRREGGRDGGREEGEGEKGGIEGENEERKGGREQGKWREIEEGEEGKKNQQASTGVYTPAINSQSLPPLEIGDSLAEGMVNSVGVTGGEGKLRGVEGGEMIG